MCRYFSCILTKDKKVIWDKRTISHEKLIENAKLIDDRLVNRNFIRMEIIPKDEKNITRNKKDWKLVVDENDTIPEWYQGNKEKLDKLCWNAWKKSIEINLLVKKENGRFEDVFALCTGNSTSTHRDNSSSKHWRNSTSKHFEFSVGHIFNDIKNHKILSETAVLIDHKTKTIWVKKGAKVKEM